MTSKRLLRGVALGVLAGLLGGVLATADPKAEDSLAVTDNLLRQGDAAAAQTLRGLATSASDLRVREHAILALAQIGKEDSIPTLVEIGTAPTSREIQTAAFNAVYELRKRFPMKNPPSVTLKALTPVAVGQEMVFEVTVVSPVDRSHARIDLRGSKTLQLVRDPGSAPVYEGPLQAGKTVKVRATFESSAPSFAEIRASARVSLDAVDATTYTAPLYLVIQDGSGSASPTPPAAWGKAAPKTSTPR
jgi:hypothetical protein